MKDLNFLLELAKSAAFEGGKEILKFYQSSEILMPINKKDEARAYEIYIKPDKSPVTQADLASNDKIFEILSKSGLPICSEEKILDENASEFWLIDPLDGTNDFISGVGEFCVCIALIQNYRPILGVIYVPISNEIYFAAKGLGTHYEKLKNFSSIQDQIASFSKQNLANKSQKRIAISRYGKNKIPLLLSQKLNLEPLHLSSAIKFCKIAEGMAEIYARFSPSSIWDNAAGEVIASEAGAVMIDLKTQNPPLYQTSNLKSNEFVVISKEFLDQKDEILAFIKEQI
ncbi:inositol monophosphatase family protein [Campylobacter sp. RM16190]|uniref:3'(2'),5'-bisphosphate nucleotidase CysQ family protein n=1 Tax=Campylobacter sp. RM16190 TaxID=1705727 RepID=UPI0014742174|nr:inositol monophosphatase family protein [Campylobacter sp. RM16190]